MQIGSLPKRSCHLPSATFSVATNDKVNIMITQKELKYYLNYDCDSGVFTWLNPKANKVSRGDIAGGCQHGYINIKIDSVTYKAHRLVWLYINGVVPENIDHINGVKSDNRIKNLRDVSHRENMRNMKKRDDNKTGLTGVYIRKDSGKFGASIRVNTKIIHLGTFDNIFDAACVRKSAEVRYGFHANHGRAA